MQLLLSQVTFRHLKCVFCTPSSPFPEWHCRRCSEALSSPAGSTNGAPKPTPQPGVRCSSRDRRSRCPSQGEAPRFPPSGRENGAGLTLSPNPRRGHEGARCGDTGLSVGLRRPETPPQRETAATGGARAPHAFEETSLRAPRASWPVAPRCPPAPPPPSPPHRPRHPRSGPRDTPAAKNGTVPPPPSLPWRRQRTQLCGSGRSLGTFATKREGRRRICGSGCEGSMGRRELARHRLPQQRKLFAALPAPAPLSAVLPELPARHPSERTRRRTSAPPSAAGESAAVPAGASPSELWGCAYSGVSEPSRPGKSGWGPAGVAFPPLALLMCFQRWGADVVSLGMSSRSGASEPVVWLGAQAPGLGLSAGAHRLLSCTFLPQYALFYWEVAEKNS